MAKKSRKVFATTATAALVASAVAPIASSAAGFSDVTKPEYKTAIDALAEAGILNGYENGTFKPENKVTRGEVAKVITLIRHLEEGTKTPFKDVKDGYWSTQYINSLYAAKLVNGYEDGTFKPEGNVTRAEFAKLVVDAYGLTLTNAATPFTDVKAGNWATPYIQTAYANGLIKGVTASKFDPSAPIKRGDLAILLHRADSKFGDVIGNNFPGVELVKATNATTVEVTFKNEVDAKDVQASKFAIDGLTVTNAAVKQTDSKTVVLTTSPQEGGKQYTVKSGSATLGKFIGVSAVTPESISVVTNSLQGVVGKEVTVKAQVKVKDGESKAGIPVTFNINAKDKKFNKDYVVEVYTNADGVAEYSYTQYAGGEDLVTAYATGNANVRSSSGKVYWGVKDRLTITEVKEGNSLPNGSKKVYKVKATTETGGAASGFVNVAFAENVDVTPDKGVKGATITDASFYGLTDSKGNNKPSNVKYPYQYTNGNENGVRVELKNGEATFTVTGENVSVTPVVFFDGVANDAKTTWTGDDVLGATELQAKAPTVKFENIQLVELAVESLGTKDAAGISTAGEGGRDYKVTVKDKDGKLAPKGTKVYVTVADEDLEGNVYLQRSAANGGNFKFTGKADNKVEVVTDKDGVAKFTLIGDINAYATPTVYIDNGSKTGELDKSDAQAKGEIVYFGKAVVEAAKLSVVNDKNEAVESVKAGEAATFVYQVVDQNGKAYKVGSHNATFEVYNNGYNEIQANGVKVAPYKHASVPFTTSGNDGKSTLKVTASGVTTVKVEVSGSQYTLGNQTATVAFTDPKEMPATHTGIVTDIDTTDKLIKLDSYDAVSYAGASFKNVNGVALNETQFENLVKQYKGTIKVTAVKAADGKYSFEIVSLNADLTNALSAINAATTNAEVVTALENSGLTPDYTSLTSAQKTAIAGDVLTARNSATGQLLSEAGLKVAYANAYKTQADLTAKALADAYAAKGAALTGTEVESYITKVLGLDLSKVNSANKVAVYGHSALTTFAGTNLAQLQTAVDTAVKAAAAADTFAAVNDNTLTRAQMETALRALPGINLTEFDAAASRVKALALADFISGTSAGKYTSVVDVNRDLRGFVTTHKDDTSVGITSITYTANAGGAGTPDTLDIVFTDDVDLPATIASADLGTLGISFADSEKLGSDSSATYDSATHTLTITLDSDNEIIKSASGVTGSVLKTISVKDKFGFALNLAAVKSDGTTKVTDSADLEVK